MERMMYKISGVVIAFMLVFSLAATFAVSEPAVAGTQKWSEINMPGEKMQLLPDSDISTIAVTPDGETLFAGVLVNQSTEEASWILVKSTDGGYTWKRLGGYDDLGYSDEQIVAIKVSPDWADDGRIYVATNAEDSGYIYMSNDSGKTWIEWAPIGAKINSMDVALDASGNVTVLIGDEDDVWLYDDGEWKDQNAGGTPLAVAFSPNYAEDGTIVAVVNDSATLRLRAETDIDANNWGEYLLDAFFTYSNGVSIEAVPAQTGSIAFSNDFGATSVIFVGLNTENSGYTVGISMLPGTDGDSPKHQAGDVFKISMLSGILGTSEVQDLDVRGEDTGTDIWSLGVSGNASSANIVCGLRYTSQIGSLGDWQMQIHSSVDGGNNWSFSIKPPSGMGADIATPEIGICAPVVVMSPNFATDDTVYCGNGYYSTGIILSGFYVSTDQGATWNGRGLLDRNSPATDPLSLTITDIQPSSTYATDNTIYMVTADTETVVVPINIGLLWKTVDGGSQWEIICDMLPLESILSTFSAVCIDKVSVAGEAVFIAGINDAIGMNPVPCLVLRSVDAGKSFTTAIATRGPVEHLIAIDSNTLITANGSNVWLTTNSGAKWTKADGDIESTETITDLAINSDSILAGTDAGNVYLCDDYTTDFCFLQIGNTLGEDGDTVKVAFDTNYTTNNIVYATITGNATQQLYRIDAATSTNGTEWTTLPTDVTCNNNVWTCGNFTSISCDSNGILWALCDATNSSNISDIKTGVAIRSVNPTASNFLAVNFELIDCGLSDVLAGTLRTSGRNVFAVGGESWDKLWIYTDTLIKVTLVSPADGATAVGDLLAGTSNARVVLQWADLPKADSYQYQVALDSEFEGIVAQNSSIAGTQAEVILYASTKYYWRVRVAPGGPVCSQWSDIWSFTTLSGPSGEAPVLLSPTAGQYDVILRPLLQWSGLAGATKYELQVAKGCNFSGSNLIVDKTGSNALGAVTAYQMRQSLIEGTSYCWKVRALSDFSSSAWSNIGTFTTQTISTPEGWWDVRYNVVNGSRITLNYSLVGMGGILKVINLSTGDGTVTIRVNKTVVNGTREVILLSSRWQLRSFTVTAISPGVNMDVVMSLTTDATGKLYVQDGIGDVDMSSVSSRNTTPKQINTYGDGIKDPAGSMLVDTVLQGIAHTSVGKDVILPFGLVFTTGNTTNVVSIPSTKFNGATLTSNGTSFAQNGSLKVADYVGTAGTITTTGTGDCLGLTLVGLPIDFQCEIKLVLEPESVFTSTPTPTPTPTLPSGGSGGGGGDSVYQKLQIKLWDKSSLSGNWLLDSKGILQSNVSVTSLDGAMTINISKGTTIVDSGGKTLSNISVAPIAPSAVPPGGYHILSAFEFSPSGAKFNPGMTITITFNASEVSPGETVKIALYNASAASWEFIDGKVNSNGTATFTITHFSVYAVMAEEGGTPTPAPTLTPVLTPTPAPEGSSDGMGTGLIVGIVSGIAVVLAAAIWLTVYRRKKQA